MSEREIDPTAPASEDLKRSVFVGISAAATLAASSAAASAQEPLGQPHPPLVAENDPAITVEHVKLERPNAVIPAYAAWPAAAGPGTPSIVVIMHIWGVDTSIRDVVRRYAKAGFAAIAPDLYARYGAPSGDGSTDYTIFRPYAKQLDRTIYAGDIRAAALWLSTKFPGTKIGLTGFCMGGHIAWNAALDDANLFSVVAPFYGAVDGVDPKAIAIPVCGSFGGRDTGIPAADVRAFAAALTVPNDVRVYDEAGHAFFDDQRASYVASAAADAWKRTLACFDKYLRGITK
ncbi:MAG: dienelactone hydrolase family protein [Candidatus Cybelea sp.]